MRTPPVFIREPDHTEEPICKRVIVFTPSSVLSPPSLVEFFPTPDLESEEFGNSTTKSVSMSRLGGPCLTPGRGYVTWWTVYVNVSSNILVDSFLDEQV